MKLHAFVMTLGVCAACDVEDPVEVAARDKELPVDPKDADKPPPVDPEDADKPPPVDPEDADKPPSQFCSEAAFEAKMLFGPGHQFVSGFGDLPYNAATCEALASDGDGDHVIDGQAVCDQRAHSSQGLPPGATHFVTYQQGESTQCGCTCGERSACDQPAKYTDYDAIGAGTFADPHEIYTAAQLRDIAGDPDAWHRSYVQCLDINLAPHYSPLRPYFMIPEFSGDYDGQGRAIRGFTYDSAGPYYAPPAATEHFVGLFGYLSGRVSRLSLTDAFVSMLDEDEYLNLGVLSGQAAFADVWKLNVDGRVEAYKWNATVGGVSAYIYGGRYTDITVDMSLAGLVAGGIAYSAGGLHDAHFERIRSTVDIEAGYYGGGIAGTARGHVRDSRVDGTIHAYDAAGAIFQYTGSLRGVASDVDIVARFSAGGLVHTCQNCDVANTRASGSITAPEAGGLINLLLAYTGPSSVVDSYASGAITGDDSLGHNTLGGLIGVIDTDGGFTVARCYSSGDVSGISTYGSVGGAVAYAANAEILDVFSTGAATGPNALPFGLAGSIGSPAPIDPSNRYDSDVNPIVPDQGTPVSGATGVFSDPNTHFGYDWPVGAGGWTFTPGQLPTLTDLP
jgi:hypothetical protein